LSTKDKMIILDYSTFGVDFILSEREIQTQWMAVEGCQQTQYVCLRGLSRVGQNHKNVCL
jgi:hypothetical protein